MLSRCCKSMMESHDTHYICTECGRPALGTLSKRHNRYDYEKNEYNDILPRDNVFDNFTYDE